MSGARERTSTLRRTALASALAAVLGACSATIWMPGGPFTQAQLISGLEAHGYRDVMLGDEVASLAKPHPELLSTVRSADDPTAQKTPVHLGWNGTAVKDGQTINIYLGAEAPASLPRGVASARRGQDITLYLDRIAERTVQERTEGKYLEPGSLSAPLPTVSAANGSNQDMPTRSPATSGSEMISADIALRLAEMVFVRAYGKEVTDAQLPLLILDHGDRWEIQGRKAVLSSPGLNDPPGGRLGMTIMKADGRIVEVMR